MHIGSLDAAVQEKDVRHVEMFFSLFCPRHLQCFGSTMYSDLIIVLTHSNCPENNIL